ncbi:hypothetical protein [Streptomyces sp. SP18CS02]|uniref:hypothetical protein n=1 Tax=Streptomyces sp. SP18CS02 TaxID=3002531 RepID=UPI002E76156D|nr:hypothetical protein [Streptomyces sp. SP18CS02]MEE1757438.1 hypothetical protein [Streptomyces sp. SP18CS02]
MTGVIIVFFALAAVTLALALADQRWLYRRLMAWRYRDPAAHEPSDAACRAGRVLAFLVCGALLFMGFRALDFTDDSSWNRSELRSVVEAAAGSLEEDAHIGGAGGAEGLIRDALRDAADSDGEGPSYDLAVEAQGAQKYAISTLTGEYPFCLTLGEEESSGGGVAVPGADGSTTVITEYDLTADVSEGRCS